MEWQIIGGFLLATAVFLATPGPVMAIVIGNTLNGGQAMGLRTVLGIGLGEVMVLGLLTLSLLMSSRLLGDVFPWFSLASAGYLVWLAATTLFCASGPTRREVTRLSSRPFVDGFAITVSNPTALLFYSAFFMPFVARSESPAMQFAILASLYVPLSLAVDLACVLIVDRLTAKCFRSTAFAHIGRMASAVVYLATSVLAISSFLQMIRP